MLKEVQRIKVYRDIPRDFSDKVLCSISGNLGAECMFEGFTLSPAQPCAPVASPPVDILYE